MPETTSTIRRLRGSLAARILTGVTVAVGFALALTTAYFSIEQRAALDRDFRDQSQSFADALAAFAIEQLVAIDYPSLEYAIGVAGRKNEEIQQIEVLHEGRLAALYRRSEHSAGASFNSAVTWQDGTGIGEVRIVFSTNHLAALRNVALRDSLVTMLAIFVALGASLGFLLRRGVIRPVEELTARIEQAIGDALPELADSHDKDLGTLDEIIRLERRFTSLLDGLELRDRARSLAEKALIENQQNLERLVGERTDSLRAAEQEAVRQSQVKSQFLAAASHDLRQPMQAIGLFLHALERSKVNPEQAQLVASLSASARLLGELLDALLDISKLDAGAVVPNVAPVDIYGVFAELEGEFSQLALAKMLRFIIVMPPQTPVIQTDQRLLLAILRNLVGNAIKYTDRGGVLIAARRRRGELLIQVWDTGIGIAAADREQVYREFFQVHNPQRDRSRGLGLGLSIVRRLVTLLGYEIDCRSVPGKGTVFTIRVPDPLIANRGLSDSEAMPAEELGDVSFLRGRRVVIIEDDQLAAEGLCAMLGSYGLIVTAFANAGEALAAPDLTGADFYVSDYRLPGSMDGLQLLQTIRQRAGRPVDGLIVTGDTAAEQMGVFAASGWRVLHKPVCPVTLIAAIRDAVRPSGSAGRRRSASR
ncbi:MAG: response regulator [Betaproteobacteria bacterium]|nr:response regulator [Betaproteobacteria bacterium]